MKPRQLVLLVIRWSPLVVLLAAVGAVVGYAGTRHQTVYSASAIVYVGTPTPTADPNAQNDSTAFNQLLVTLSDMVPTATIARQALARPGAARSVEQAVAETRAWPVYGSDLIDITVVDRSPQVAADLANRMAAALSTYTKPAPGGGSSGVIVEPVSVFQPAGIPSAPVPAGGRLHRVLEGALLGAVVAVLAVLLVDSLRSPGPSSSGEGSSGAERAGGPDDV